jgi:putative ABC transport system substrate-binding protein
MVSDEPQFTLGPGPAAIAAAALRHGMPTAGPTFFANSGGLMTYAVDFLPMARRAAYFVDKILKGTKPGDIPIEQATKFITTVNLKTAKALGLDIPPTLLAAADEVIE